MSGNGRKCRTTSNGSNATSGPDHTDVAMMSTALAQRFGGEVCFGCSLHPTMATVIQITALYLAPRSGAEATDYSRTVLATAQSEVPHGGALNLPAHQYRLLWELEAALVEKKLGPLDW